MPKRAKTKKFLPGVYELPGGHIDFGENLIKGLKREIREEFEVEIIYFAQFIDKKLNIVLHPEDHGEYIWIKESEIDMILIKNKLKSDDPEIKTIRKGFNILSQNMYTILK